MIISCLKTLLKEEGHLLIVDLDKEDGSFHAKYDFDGHNGFDQTELIKLSQRVGFSKAESEIFYHGNKEFENKISEYALFILDCQK